MTNTTDTPRTDYFVNAVTRIEPQEDWIYPMVQFARELERELAEERAEVERLLTTLKFLRDECDLGKRTFRRVSEAINQSYQ